MTRLRDEGYLVCPGSSAVPVEVRGVRPDGVGVHFRCRGTTIRLALYRPGRARWQVPIRDGSWCPEESLQLWEHHPLHTVDVPAEACLALPSEGQADHEAAVDGAVEWGWRGHEAGLLRPGAAAEMFDDLMATLLAAPALVGAVDEAAEPTVIGGDRTGRTAPARAAWGAGLNVAVPAARARPRRVENVQVG